MNNYIKLLSSMILLSIFLGSCDEDDPTIPNEEELITTVILELEDKDGNHFDFIYEDLDGDGGNAPEITSPKLTANTTYTGSIEFLNESSEEGQASVANSEEEGHGHEHGKDVTEEIKKEAEDHQVFYLLDPVSLAQVTYDDTDANGNPIGLNVEITTGDAGTGQLTVTLRHEPKKPNNGTLSDAGGSTDVEVPFDLVVE